MAGWRIVRGSLTQIDVGSDAFVWGVDKQNRVFRLVGGDDVWEEVPGKLKQVSVGGDGTVYGVEPNGKVVRFTGIGPELWEDAGIQLKQVSVGSRAFVWGVNEDGEIFRLAYNGSEELDWVKVDGYFDQVEVGSDGTVVALDERGQIYNYVQLNEEESAWLLVPGNLRSISVGSERFVLGVNEEHEVFRFTRGGEVPWARIPGHMKQVAIGNDGTTFGVEEDDEVHYRLRGTPLMVSDGRLQETSLSADDEAEYHFLLTNTDEKNFIHDIHVNLSYDHEVLAEKGITIVPNHFHIEQMLPGESRVMSFGIITKNATAGPYGVWGVTANSALGVLENLDIEGKDIWLNFQVNPD